MKFLINFLLIALFPFVIKQGDAGVAEDNKVYCNARYDFCIEYPEKYFSAAVEADNGDGITLSTFDGDGRVAVFGSFNVMNWSLEDIYYFNFEAAVRENPEVKTVESHLDGDQGDVTMQVGNETRFFRIWRLKDTYVTMEIDVDKGREVLLEDLKKSVVFHRNS